MHTRARAPAGACQPDPHVLGGHLRAAQGALPAARRRSSHLRLLRASAAGWRVPGRRCRPDVWTASRWSGEECVAGEDEVAHLHAWTLAHHRRHRHRRRTTATARAGAGRSRLYFLLAWIHCVILERLRYAPVGWSKGFEFSEVDYFCAMDAIDEWVDRVSQVAWLPSFFLHVVSLSPSASLFLSI